MNDIKRWYFNRIVKIVNPQYADDFTKLNNLYYLKITDDKEHQKLSGKISCVLNLSIFCFCAIMFLIIVKFLPQNIETAGGLNFVIGVIFIFLALTLLFLVYSSLVQIIFSLLESHCGNKIISKSLLLQIPVVLYLGTGGIFAGNDGAENNLSKFWDKELKVPLQELGDFGIIIILVLIAIILIFINYVWNLTVIEAEEVNKSNSILTGFLAIVGVIWGINFEPQPESNVIVTNFIPFFIFFAIIMTTFLPGIISWRCKHSYKKAEEIFQEQLLVKPGKINYDRLKLCYYYGGETYKDKMLSNEKMLRIIMRKENRCP